ncbi:Uncharacterised protein [Bacillus freudenreichii]|nr:Uncharacterised protein [Bacillus freudenreichii]
MIAVLLLQGERNGDVRVLSLQGNEVVIELQLPVYDDKVYQIQIDGNQFNLEFTYINGTFEKHQAVYYEARGFIFR